MLFEIVMNLVYEADHDIANVTTGVRRIVTADNEADARAYAIANEHARQAGHQAEGTTPYTLASIDITSARQTDRA
jgi:hypothetical protein